jgi:hypothetical protein
VNVLVTGMTGLQLGRPGRYGLTTFAKLLPEIFGRARHEVDQRAVVPGEPLGQYDVVLVGLVGPASMTGRNDYRYGALDAIGRAQAEGCGLGFFLEGNVRKIDTDLKYLLGGEAGSTAAWSGPSTSTGPRPTSITCCGSWTRSPTSPGRSRSSPASTGAIP